MVTIIGIYFSGDFIGLYGNNDGIKDNDLVSRNGELVKSNASMIDIHNQFGLTCKYIPMCVFLCVFLCVCACVRACVRAYVCVCVCVWFKV